MKIGIFDSGMGGLNILHAVSRYLPSYSYIFYADTKNLPYGDKSEEEIRLFTECAMRELFVRDAALVIVACNTASVETLRTLQDTMLVGEYSDKRILGMVVPTVEELLEGRAKHALLIGTTRTIGSQKYAIELEKRKKPERKLTLDAFATPGLVPLIEARDFTGACRYFENVAGPRMGEVDTLILGCTHYTVLKDWIRVRFPHLRILSQDEIIPSKLKSYLKCHPEMSARLTRGSVCEYIITGDAKDYLNSVREYATS